MATAVATNSSGDREASHESLVILTLAICLFGLLGNGVLVWLLCFCVKSSPFSVYSCNLAVANFLLLFSMALLFILERPELALRPKSVSRVFQSVRYLAYMLGLSLLTAVSAQRCLALVFPAWYRRHQPKRLSARVCAGLWALATLQTVLATSFCVQSATQASCRRVFWLSLLSVFGVFTPVMCVSSVTLFIKVQRACPPHQPLTPYIIPVVTQVLVYVACALPLGLSWFFLHPSLQDGEEKRVFYDVVRLFSCVSSTINPFLYFLGGSQEAETLPAPSGTASKGPGERGETLGPGGESGAQRTVGQLSGGAA
ncbi:mas-related G-protein coupled receptor member D-like [Monodelphis domestica]|uniref:mas-related G-protein coupled receptor member D-like n=1 Tax=Monodelphis domestica TaxID=13616 RepID=UPI0024E1B7BD|nr:mas-related G-protein coupled receptor member D-like [Monodelphis domestica]